MAKTINSIDRTATVANVVDAIRNKIILQEYPAGQKLTELALSAEYKISRGSVRTALQVMENEGLIATLPNGRKLVVGITEKFVTDLYETRGMLECESGSSHPPLRNVSTIPVWLKSSISLTSWRVRPTK